MSSPQILNRPLKRAWLDAALWAARASDDLALRQERLTDVLDQAQLGSEARRKTARVLGHIWLSPPPRARPFIDWAIMHADGDDTRVLHIGAMLGTYPFIGDVYSAAGMRLRRAKELDNKPIRSKVVSKWGDREAIHRAVVMALNTLSSLGILEGEPYSGIWKQTTELEVPASLEPWLAHAILLSRNATSIDASAVLYAPELFALSLKRIAATICYPYLEVHTEGGNKKVFTERS